MVGMTRAFLADPHHVAQAPAGPGSRNPPLCRRRLLRRPGADGQGCALYPQCRDRPRARPRPCRRTVRRAGQDRRRGRRRARWPRGGAGVRRCAAIASCCSRHRASSAARSCLPPAPPGRRELLGIARFLAGEMERLGVDVRLNTLAAAADIAAATPDAVIIATGGLPDTGNCPAGSWPQPYGTCLLAMSPPCARAAARPWSWT